MDAVLAAVREGGGDRRAVTRAALVPVERRGVTGRMRQVRSGDVVRGRVALVPLDGGTPRIRPLGPVTVVQPVGTRAPAFARRADAPGPAVRYS